MKSGIAMGLASALLILVAQGCGDPPSLVGQACQTDDHCGTEGGLDLTCDHGVPGGYCTLAGCDLDDSVACPGDSACVTSGDATACLQTCETVLDCREVIACGPDPDCDPGLEECDQVCANGMRCVLPPGAQDDALGTCQFSAP